MSKDPYNIKSIPNNVLLKAARDLKKKLGPYPNIIRRKCHRCGLTGPTRVVRAHKCPKAYSKRGSVTYDQAVNIRQLYKEVNPKTGKKWTQMDLADQYKVSHTEIQYILYWKIHKGKHA